VWFIHSRIYHKEPKTPEQSSKNPFPAFAILGAVFLCGRFCVQYSLVSELTFKVKEKFMPEVGDMAPEFELKSHLEKDKKIRLSDFRGKQNVVIAFYPLAWTPV
jgi:hypothetical protein